jgi:hypothetical protein
MKLRHIYSGIVVAGLAVAGQDAEACGTVTIVNGQPVVNAANCPPPTSVKFPSSNPSTTPTGATGNHNTQTQKNYTFSSSTTAVDGKLSGCAFQSAGNVSILGIGIGLTTGTGMVPGCSAADERKAAIEGAMNSGNVGLQLIGLKNAGFKISEDEIRMAQATQAFTNAVTVVPIIVGGNTQPAQPTLPPCTTNIPGYTAKWVTNPKTGSPECVLGRN